MRNMRGLMEGAAEWLRPLIDSKEWDYCVVWKLGDDPSRFIEWLGCCCGGAGGGDYKSDNGGSKVKIESAEELCKDVLYKHPLSSKACEALAKLPYSIPLYSGVHGEVVIARQPRWTHNAIALDTDPSPLTESVETRVFIPASGGLVELFAARNIAEDQNIVACVVSLWNAHLEQGAIIPNSYANLSFYGYSLDQLLDENLQNLPSLCRLLSGITPLQVLPTATKPNTHPCLLERSSSDSNPSNEHPSFDSYSGHMLEQRELKPPIAKPYGSRKSKNIEKSTKQWAGSRNLVTERNRRKKINNRLLELRALVPNISKMDKVSILGDATEYIEKLLKEIKGLQDELREIDGEEDCKERNSELQAVKLEALYEGSRRQHHAQDQPGSSSLGETRDAKVQPEVNQINRREFLIKFLSEQRQGGVARLLDGIYSLGLQVMDANVTSFNGKVLNILKVQANKDIQPKKLTETLIQLTM